MIGLLLSASVLILVIIALRHLLRDKISLSVQYAMWLLVALRLLIPVEFGSSSLSLQNYIGQEPKQESAIIAPSISHTPETNPTSTSEINPTLTPATTFPTEAVSVPPPKETEHTETLPHQPYEPIQQETALSGKQIANLIWAIGASGMLLWFVMVNIRFRIKVHKGAHPLEVEDYPIPVFVNENLSSPCLVGLLRPKIYLPCETEERTQRHILIHEQTHHRHLDPLWAWVRGLCLCLYWFHPLVWWAAILSKQDCELACDEGALKRLGEQERIAYGDTLLSMVSLAGRPHGLFRTATTMAESKKQLKERVEMIVKQPKKLWLALLCLVLILAITVGCTFTGKKHTEFLNPTVYWCTSFKQLFGSSGTHTYPGVIESLQRATANATERIDAMENVDTESKAYAFLQNILQVADLLEKESGDSFYNLPQWEQEALLEGWYILANANYATSEEEYLKILESQAGLWLDPWIFGSSGYILPIDDPVLPPTMEPARTLEPSTDPASATENTAPEEFVRTHYQKGNYRIPQFAKTMGMCKPINGEIIELFGSVIDSDSSEFTSIDYRCFQNGTILSLLIQGERNAEPPLYKSYNIDIATGNNVSVSEYGAYGSIVPLTIVAELTEIYMETGAFAITEEIYERLKTNLYEREACLWLDGEGKAQYSFCYYPMDGGDAQRRTIAIEDYRAPENPWKGEPKVVELLAYKGYEGYDLPDSERPLCHIPFLLMSNPRAMEINAEILERYNTAFSSCEYSWHRNGDICSFSIHGIKDDHEYSIYNFSYSQGRELTPEEVYSAAGYTGETFMTAAKEAIQNYFFTRLEGTPMHFTQETYHYLAAASGGASNVGLSVPYLDEKGDLWISAKIFQVAGASYSWNLIPVEGQPLCQGYLDFLALPRRVLTTVPNFNILGYSIESFPDGFTHGEGLSASYSQEGENPVYIDPYPVGHGGPAYTYTTGLLKQQEDNLQRYLTLLFGEGSYSLQYEEGHEIQTPSYVTDDLTMVGHPDGVSISFQTDTPLTELTVNQLFEDPVLDAALRFAGIQAPAIQQRITYEPLTDSLTDYRYTVTEDSEWPSHLSTLTQSVSITYYPGEGRLRISVTLAPTPAQAGTTLMPSGVDFMEAVGDLQPFGDRYITGDVECYYSSQIVLGYYVPCYRVYIWNEAMTERNGIPTYTVFDLCEARFPTNRTEVLPWID